MPSAALVMIARDAAGTIRQCLESAQGFGDRNGLVQRSGIDDDHTVDETYCEYRSTSFLDRFDGLTAIARTMS